MDAAAGDIASAIGAGGEFVDFIKIDDAVRGAVHIAAGAADEVAHEVVHIAADIAGFAEFGCVGLHERHADEVGGGADEVGLADSGGTEQEDILFLIERRLLALEREAHMLEVVAERDGEDLLRLALADDEAVEVAGDVGGFEREGKFRGGFGRAADGGLGEGGFAVAAEFFGDARRDGAEGGGFHGILPLFEKQTSRFAAAWKEESGMAKKTGLGCGSGDFW